jgi:biotin synthase
MDYILDLKKKVLDGYSIAKEEAMGLINRDFNTLASSAKEIQNFYCGNSFDFCTIVNGKSGKCSEDCKYCAQSSFIILRLKNIPY